ncbi:TonB-dependent receptor [Steroidobacter agaridevorans]|uniref:TonB-dependent receptor n=2 Tax=Steroidobacter agaridevorans TaxID=2695856 RepID=A0A829YF68_9GAMM|nr:TonB-dependent receptor [Steroidobacter agaridevorans]
MGCQQKAVQGTACEGAMTNSGLGKKFVCGLTAFAGWAATSTVLAQVQSEAAPTTVQPASVGPEEVIVTARRRDERLQDVPLAVTAVSSAELQHQNILSVAQLSQAAPALVTVPASGGGRSQPVFTIRGLSAQELSVIGDPSVSTYLGDVVMARTQGMNAALFDVGSIEILRGPQGTLFGRNTTGGAVVIRPNRPTDRFEGRVALTGGNFETFNTEAMINVPVGELLKVRVAAVNRKDDGFVYDELLGRNINDTDQQAARVSALLTLPGDAEVLTVYDYFRDDSGSTPGFIKHVNPNGSFNGEAYRAARGYRPLETLLSEQQARGIYRVANGTPLFNDIKTHTFSNTITVPLSDDVSIKNILGYRTVWDELRDDVDGTESALFPQERNDRGHQVSEEFQLLGTAGRLDWITGLYYFREKGRTQAESYAGAVDPGPIEPRHVEEYEGPAYSITDVAGENTSYAVFAQGTYELLDGLKLTAGARYTRDEREATIRNRTRSACRFTLDQDGDPATPETTPALGDCAVTNDASFSEPTYNISLDYQFADSKLVYLAHRHGYRSGGFGSRAASQAGLARTFEPESVDDVEIGLKADWRPGDVFLRTNLAAYYSKYEDIQRILTDPNVAPVTAVTTNAGRARIQGIEAELMVRPIESLELSADYAYTDAEFTEFIAPDGTDLSNAPFARAPKNVYTFGARYTLPIDASRGDISLGGSFYHVDEYSAVDDVIPGVTGVAARELVNADVSWNAVLGSRFDLSAYVTNLLDKQSSSLFVTLNGLGFTSHIAEEPRRYGVSVRYHFGE